MPCDSGYMEPTPYDCKIKETATLLCYVYGSLGIAISSELYKASYEQVYFTKKLGNKWVNALCYALNSMPDDERDQLIYDNRIRLSRRLADWWEDHSKADTEKLKNEQDKKNREALREFALNKLTNEEKRVLGL